MPRRDGALVIRADTRAIPLPDQSVDLIVTSPPYFGQRSYKDGGEHYDGQIGSEDSIEEWLDAMWECTAEWARVLKPSGSIFVNLGDAYAAGHGGSNTEGNGSKIGVRRAYAPNPRERADLPDAPSSWGSREARVRNTVPGIPVKSLMLMPERYAIGCIDRLGLRLRAEIVWQKPNGLPESVTDRVRRSHESWFHFTIRPRYFSAIDEIRQPYQGDRALSRRAKAAGPGKHDQRAAWCTENPLGSLPGSVWSIATEPLSVPDHLGIDHFAAFPSEWPRRLILGWSPNGICTRCDEGRFPVTESERVKPPAHGEGSGTGKVHGLGPNDHRATAQRFDRTHAIIGYACACTPYTDHPGEPGVSGANQRASIDAGHYPNKGAGWGGEQNLASRPRSGAWREYDVDAPSAPTRPAVVLDPFGGTGTTAMVARALGRIGISVDLSRDYCDLARWRIFESGHGARVESRTNADRQGVLL